MKTITLTWMALLMASFTATAVPLRTGFDYQGRLGDGAQAAHGTFDFRFALFEFQMGGLPSSTTVTNTSVFVTNGLFHTAIDFGAAVFEGTQYWLEIGVRPSSSAAAFTTLAPRQAITPTPYALHALTAAGVSTNGIGNAALAADAITADKIAAGQAVKSFNGLTDAIQFSVEGDLDLRVEGNKLVLAAVASCFTYTNCYWSLRGNGNITEGTHFLGTVAGELDPLDFRVNNNRSLRHRFTGAGSAPNITGGYRENEISAGVGSTISGGGQLAGINQIFGSYDTLAGGYGNVIGGLFPTRVSAIGGGQNNHIDFECDADTIGGGETNTIEAYVRAAVIGGGSRNLIRTAATAGTIAGGAQNTNGGSYGSIGGGWRNTVDGIVGTLAGGERNWIQSGAGHSTIGGGVTNRIESDAAFATVAGGATNRIGTNSAFGVISGGGNNVVGTNSPESTISGGQRNLVEANTALATIGGGGTNRVLTTAVGATISGGSENFVSTTAPFATIPGGYRAAARSYGQLTYASGSFASSGERRRASMSCAMPLRRTQARASWWICSSMAQAAASACRRTARGLLRSASPLAMPASTRRRIWFAVPSRTTLARRCFPLHRSSTHSTRMSPRGVSS